MKMNKSKNITMKIAIPVKSEITDTDTEFSAEAKQNGAIEVDFNSLFPESQGFQYSVESTE